MTEDQPTFREHLIAFSSMGVIGVPAALLGAVAVIQILARVTGINWMKSPLPTSAWAWGYVAAVLVGTMAGGYLGIYVWLRLLKGRVPKQVVYRWLTAGPQPPVLSHLARRMFNAVYEAGTNGAA
jgi:hypothetical protein